MSQGTQSVPPTSLSWELAEQHITDFRRLYEAHFGVQLTKQQALDKGLRLIRLVETVARTIARDAVQDSLRNTDNK